VSVFIMFPDGKVSPVQEAQMTTVLDANVHNVAVEGTFDDCQVGEVPTTKCVWRDFVGREHNILQLLAEQMEESFGPPTTSFTRMYKLSEWLLTDSRTLLRHSLPTQKSTRLTG
jgi:hypothetical protein